MSAEVWSLADETGVLLWRLVAPSGVPPVARWGHAACSLAGAAGVVMLVYGGRTASGACLGDIHLFEVETPLEPTGAVAATCCEFAGPPRAVRFQQVALTACAC